NTVVLRTLSKAYSMAGYRVGWGLFPDHIGAQVRKVMNPNNLTAPSQVAAQAAVLDQTYMRDTCALTASIREDATQKLQYTGFDVVPSVTNFILILFEDGDSTMSADASLRAKGIFLRRQQGAGLPNALRMTIGTATATHTAITHLKNWKKGYTG
ncbi:MAG: aminotransferase class I/II-fold pyridoxal phosphate-dependent enzyme, partial [Pseudomonadota bacterium]